MTQYTLLITCPPSMNLSIPNAAETTRTGMAHGFSLVGIHSKLVLADRLDEALALEENMPVVWATAYDYNHIKEPESLKGIPHFVQVPPMAEEMEEVHKFHGAPSPKLDPWIVGQIIKSEPAFVHSTTPRMEKWIRKSYQGWRDLGFVVTGIPWACDTLRYFPDLEADIVEGPGVAFVGGYRVYKEPQYEMRLWPWEDGLQTWGYSEWPRQYNGQIGYHQERMLYLKASLSPCISEPQFCDTGDTVERGFKVLGSGGLTIFDGPQYCDLFRPGEILIAETADEYRDLAQRALSDKSWNLEWRAKGFAAVRERHTYMARARQIMATLGLMDYGDDHSDGLPA